MGLAAAVTALFVLAACAQTSEPAQGTAFNTPYDLIGTEWWVEDITGDGVVDNSRTTVGFPADARVAGSTGCNNYTGDVSIITDRMTFGTLAGTKRACVPALGNQEVKFYATVNKVKRWYVAEGNILHLTDNEGETLVRASLITPE
ncbi:META domain-containing protein [Marinihelvus fidelis]|uniref:META domain-containing protein n=2 Tax=Marinihelvus fidelis TaxID=2613842 RepID=A0A5N0TGN8_9GAMM|nr:META domain-containing protein [Marinihelvus fidelis]